MRSPRTRLIQRRRRKLVETIQAIEIFNLKYGDGNVLSKMLIPDRDRLIKKLKLEDRQVAEVQYLIIEHVAQYYWEIIPGGGEL